MKKKSLALVLALAMIVVCVVGGTLAWLIDKTGPVTNTFTTSDVDITLTETTTNYQMIPGYTIAKDPKVTVKAGSEDCYLFVKVAESDNFDDFMTYTMETGWTQLEDASGNPVPGVFYRVVETSTADQPFYVLAGNQVTVSGDVTKTMLNDLTADTQPTLTFTAYACQYMKNGTENFTAAEAWAEVNPTTP